MIQKKKFSDAIAANISVVEGLLKVGGIGAYNIRPPFKFRCNRDWIVAYANMIGYFAGSATSWAITINRINNGTSTQQYVRKINGTDNIDLKTDDKYLYVSGISSNTNIYFSLNSIMTNNGNGGIEIVTLEQAEYDSIKGSLRDIAMG